VIHCEDAYRLLAPRGQVGIRKDHPNILRHGLKSPLGFLSPLATYLTGIPSFKSTQITKVLRKGFDIIHYHNISLVGGPGILTYGRGMKLYTMHEYWLACPTHVLFKYNRTPCEQPRCLPCILTYKRPPQPWRYVGLLKAAVRHVDALIAPSLFSKKRHQALGLRPPIIHLPCFTPAPEGGLSQEDPGDAALNKRPYFLFVGRLEKIKGLHDMIPIFRRYKKADLLIAGKGHYEGKLRTLAQGADNILFMGHCQEERLRSLYRRAVSLVVPSICFENFPTVVLEAFSQQTPAIVRDRGGMPEAIHESGGGLVFDTERRLVEGMDRLVMDRSFRMALGLKGYHAYLEKWTEEAHLKQYFDLIRKMVPNRNEPYV
jgi:glycosyltransferase involved in cell wall biosynthesis